MAHDTFSSPSIGVEGVPAALADLLARRRVPIVGGYLVLSIIVGAATAPLDRPAVIWWLVGLVALTCAGSTHGPRRFVMDWLPLVVIAAGYDTVRSQAPDLLSRATVKPQLRFDEIVFGGTAPTVRLQRWLDVRPGQVHWWDYVGWVFYLSHFVVTLCVAAYLYVTNRARFKRLAALVLTVSGAGFLTYFIIPAVPPWLASRQGALPHTSRVVYDVWSSLGLPDVAKVFNGDARFANPVAALPSLHAAWPFMLLLFLWPVAGRLRWLLVGYNAVMIFVLVYGAEHYVSDILLGWLYALVVFIAFSRYWARRDALAAAAS
jgi:membrane-associated phospholipid phosphatase